MSLPFINIHTHHSPEPGIQSILNVILKDEEKPKIPSLGYFSCGIHPWYLDEQADTKNLERILLETGQQKRCLALGEAGLDKCTDVSLSVQQEIFKMQVRIAEQLKKPLIIHCVKAYGELLAIRKELNAPQPWIFHGFSSSVEMADQLMDHGCIISLGKAILNEKSKTRNVLSSLQAGQFFLETDDEDFSIKELYALVAEVKGISHDELKKAIYEKFRSVFRADQPNNI
jgi:TatD DNase family protein